VVVGKAGGGGRRCAGGSEVWVAFNVSGGSRLQSGAGRGWWVGGGARSG
jgi:hypothetical protein